MSALVRNGETVAAYAKEARHLVLAGLAVLALLVFGAGAWMAVTPLAGAVIATALVKVDMNRKTIQHQEGGIVKEVLVRDGTRVQPGDVLLVLDDVRVDATAELLRTQLDGEIAKGARLDAERALEPAVRYPEELTSRAGTEARVAELMRREGAVFTTRRNVLESQVKLLREQIVEARQEAASLAEQVKAEQHGLRLQQEELEANQALAEKGFMSRTRILGFERAVADYQSRLGEHQATLAQSRQRAGDFELRIVSLRNQYMQQATDELKETTSRVYDLRERLRPSIDAALRQKVVAPVAGEVVDLKVTAAGAVIAPREPLMDIVPLDPDLIVEARVRPEDILHVRTGGSADVKLTAFKARTTPTVAGQIVYVSADRLADPVTRATYYLVRLKLSREALRDAGDLQLQAGMPAEVFIRTPERTPLQYLLEPMSGFMQRSFKEP